MPFVANTRNRVKTVLKIVFNMLTKKVLTGSKPKHSQVFRLEPVTFTRLMRYILLVGKMKFVRSN